MCWPGKQRFAYIISVWLHGCHYWYGVVFKSIFLNENVWFPIEISLKFIPNGPIDKMLALVQIVAWCRPGAVLTLSNFTPPPRYFRSTRKPLQCHEIKSMNVRSSGECALYCTDDLYSCAGYVFDSKNASGRRCDVGFIHDVTNPLVAVRTSPSSVSMLTEIDKQTGKILFEMKHIDALERACRGDI